MIALPSQTKDVLKLADWLELMALLEERGEISGGYLERQLRRSGTFNPQIEASLESEGDSESASESDDEAIEQGIDNVFTELENRARAAKDAYPFSVVDSILAVRGEISDYIPYTFCLCLSYFGDNVATQNKNSKDDDGLEDPDDQPVFPRRLFEHLSTIALANYIGGKAARFGWPRRGLPTDFGEAIQVFTGYLGEGQGFNQRDHHQSKDRHVDIIAWKDFPDDKPSKLILMGQCATNHDASEWELKKTELWPEHFWDNYILRASVSQLIRAFFIPHRVNLDQWDIHSRDAGLFFDRCRLSFFASGDTSGSRTHVDEDFMACFEWINSSLEQARNY